MKLIFRQKGLSLIELLIAMALGLVLLVGVTDLYISSASTYNDSMKVSRLNQELRAVMTMMSNDIRRAGFSGAAAPTQLTIQNPFSGIAFNTNLPPTPPNPAASCILLSYDRGSAVGVLLPPDGVLNIDTESFGYRLSNGTIQSRVENLGCDDNGWQTLTDKSITITNLQFALNAQPINGPDADNDGTADYVLTVRDVRILITGRLTNDATISRTLDTTVRVRNDLFTIPGT